MKKRLFIIITLVLFASFTLPDLLTVNGVDGEYAITVILQDSGGNNYSGVNMNLYRVADITQHNGAGVYSFSLYGGFTGSGERFDVFTAPEHYADEYAALTGRLVAWARSNALEPLYANNPTNREGKAEFGGLSTGLYLVTQASVTYNGRSITISPMLIPLPYYDYEEENGGVWSDAVSLWLKFTLGDPPATPPPTPTTPPPTTPPPPPTTPPPSSPPPTTPTPPPSTPPPSPTDITPQPPPPSTTPLDDDYIELDDDVPLADMPPDEDEDEIQIPEPDIPLDDIPKTGLAAWPVPLLAISGILAIIAGVILYMRIREGEFKKD